MNVFAYDPIGNRISATDYDETGAAHTSLYAANALNQYVSRTVPGWASVRGLAHSNAYVTVNGSAAFRVGEYYFGSDQFDNSAQAGFAELETVAVLGGATNDLVSVETNTAFVAAATETFTYDDDGNLTEDGHFRYLWNGENRMIRAEEKVSPPDRSTYVITYDYDHIGRNVAKDGVRYIWDGYNIIVENAGTANATYNTWGLDLDGTLQGVGGVGGLLTVAKEGESSLPAYDGNGNITEYVSEDGAIVSHNDYSSFGREMMSAGIQDHSHRFSTKPTCRRSGIVEFQCRIYSPYVGRWRSRDFVETHIPYAYLYNSVLLFVEYLGLYGNPVVGPGGSVWGPSTPYDPGGPYDPNPPWHEQLPDCPCSIPIDPSGCPDKNGAGDGWTSPDKTGHAGGSWEIRSNPTASGAGQQCVYDSAGNLINQGPGAGTPDRISPPEKWWHDIGRLARHVYFDGWQWVFGTNYDHETHPPNQGRDSNGNPCPPNDGSSNPPKCEEACK